MEPIRLSENMDRIQVMVFTGLLYGIALILSLVESLFPIMPALFPGIKLGLSNIAVMYAVFFLGAKQAYMITILKASFVLITRGFIAGTLSLAGGLLSITGMFLILFLFRDKVSYMGVSIIGAVSHNVGQFLVVMFIYIGTSIWVYLPVLLVFGVIAGIITATLLRIVMPAIKKLILNTNIS